MGKISDGPVSSFLEPSDELLRVKFTEVQRKKIAELCSELSSRLKLDQKNQRVVELRRSELEQVAQKAKPALNAASGQDRPPLRKIVETIEEQRSRAAGRQVYRLRIDLRDSKPPIWRRIEVEDCTLEDLHDHIQAAMGWMNSHLYEFEVDGGRYSSPPPLDDGWWDETDAEDAAKVRLSELIADRGPRLRLNYLYDFGDAWEHTVKLEEIHAAEPRRRYPICTDGRRACPPEDCGGIWGYYDFVVAITDPKHEEHEEMLEWHGAYKPEAFSAETATRRMRQPTRW
jgi:hypothetical protein